MGPFHQLVQLHQADHIRRLPHRYGINKLKGGLALIKYVFQIEGLGKKERIDQSSVGGSSEEEIEDEETDADWISVICHDEKYLKLSLGTNYRNPNHENLSFIVSYCSILSAERMKSS